MMSEKKKIKNDVISQQRGILMGISIILIIVFHFTEDCETFAFHYDGWVKWFRMYIGSSSVDAFLFLSGLGLYYSMKKNPDVRSFYKRRLTKILIPYTLVALPAWILRDLVVKPAGVWNFVRDFTFLSFKDGEKWYWYIVMILICYLIFPYIFQIVGNAKDSIEGEMYLLILVGVFTVLLLGLKLFSKGEVYSNVEIALTRFPIFAAGAFYGRSSYEQRESYWKWGVILGVCVLALYLFPGNMPILGRYIRGLLNVSVCALLAVLFSKAKLCVLKKILGWFGTHSLELYLTHVTVRKMMSACGFATCHYRYELIMVAIALFSAWLLAIVCAKLQSLLTKRVQA